MVGFGLREREGTGSVKTLLTCLVGHDVDGGSGWIAYALLLSLVATVVLFTTPPDCKVMPLPSRHLNDLSRGQRFLNTKTLLRGYRVAPARSAVHQERC